MVQKLQEYDNQIVHLVHRPGDKHCNADGLSRRSKTE